VNIVIDGENEIGLQIAHRILKYSPMDRDDYYHYFKGNIKCAHDLLALNTFSFDPDSRKITFQSKLVEVYMRKKMEDEERKKIEDEERKKM